MTIIDKKIEKLQRTIRSLGSTAVAFSGGADSTLVAKIAHDELGEKAIAVTIDSPLYPSSELTRAKDTARKINIHHVVVRVNPLASQDFVSNSANRCYLCKLDDLKQVRRIAELRGLREVADGSNA